jgi:hypothetical protein
MQQPWLTRQSTMMTKHGVVSLTTGRVSLGTRQAVSLHRRNTAKDDTGMIEICVMSPTIEMHAAGSKTGIRSASASNRSNVKKGTMTTMIPITTDLSRRGHNAGGVKAFSHDLKMVHWPLNFKPLGIKKYDGSTNPVEWLEVYQLTIEAAGGDTYVMANYLPVCLSSSTRT